MLRGALRVVLAVVGLSACSSPDPSDQPARFVVATDEPAFARPTLRVAVAWIPPAGGGSLPVTDCADPPEPGEDFAWLPEGPPPSEAWRGCTEIECDPTERVALAWIVAFEDEDGDGSATIRVPTAAPLSAADLVAEGADRLMGLATDHAVVFAERDLAPDDVLARILGWPLQSGPAIMRVRRAVDRDLLEPVSSRERVPVYLLPRDDDDGLDPSEEPGLCCEQARCARDGVHCPTFQGQGDRVD